MPLLPLENFLFPTDLFERSRPADGEARWWVLHTRPRAEKSLARHLSARPVPFFLPLYQHRWRRRGRLFRSHLPLFPGYLFLYGDGPARLAALETNLVATCLPVVDQARLHRDLVRVHRLVTGGGPVSPEGRLEPGTPVEVVSGPLAGLEGKVLRRGSQLRFVVEVQLLQRGVSVEVEGWMIQPLDRRHAAQTKTA